MEMTNKEIVRSYRQAKDRRKQIRILSELNAVKQSVIAEILRTAGETVPPLRGRPARIDVEKEVVRSNAGIGIEVTNAEAGGVLPDVAALQEEKEPRHAATERMQQLSDETADSDLSATVPAEASASDPRQAVFHRAEQVLLLLRETDPPGVQRDVVLLASAFIRVDAVRIYNIKFDH